MSFNVPAVNGGNPIVSMLRKCADDADRQPAPLVGFVLMPVFAGGGVGCMGVNVDNATMALLLELGRMELQKRMTQPERLVQPAVGPVPRA